MGLVHTKFRNRLELDWVKKTVYLKSALQREQEILGWTCSRLKRKIDSVGSTPESLAVAARTDSTYEIDWLGDLDAVSFPEGTQNLIAEAEADVDEDDSVRYA
jgi:hypothetical protein